MYRCARSKLTCPGGLTFSGLMRSEIGAAWARDEPLSLYTHELQPELSWC